MASFAVEPPAKESHAGSDGAASHSGNVIDTAVDFSAGETWTEDELDELDLLVWHDEEPEEWYGRYDDGGLHPVRIGDQLADGKYTIFHKLGVGSFSSVWLARDMKKECNVAIKIMASGIGEYSNETEILRLIASHESVDPVRDHLQAILDSFTHHGPNGLHACIVSTPAWATIAQSHFRRDHEMMFPLESARCIIAQLITGVASLHSAGIVHGDLHTGNILLSLPRDRLMDQTIEEVYKRHGRPTKIPLHLYQEMTLRKPAIPANAPPYIVKSLDLGGACDTIKPADAKVFIGDFSESWKPSSQTKHTLSTQYPSRAPEFMCGEKLKIPMGLPSDIWSLGCLIYRLLGPRNILESRAPDDDAVFAGIVGMLGKPPQEWWNAWDNRGKYFDGYDAKEVAQDILDGNGKPDQKRASLQRRVQVWLPEDGRSNISSEEQRDLLALLNPIFQWRSEDRPTASQLLSSSWMTKWGLPAVKAMEQASVQTVNKDADKGDPKVSNDPDTESQKLVQTEVVDKMKDGENSKTGNKLQEGNKPETGGKEEIGEKMKAGKADTVEAKTDETKIGRANTGGTKTQTTSTAKVVPVKQIVGKK